MDRNSQIVVETAETQNEPLLNSECEYFDNIRKDYTDVALKTESINCKTESSHATSTQIQADEILQSDGESAHFTYKPSLKLKMGK